jgi:hypothetical protein
VDIPLGIRIESGPWLAFLLLGVIIVTPILFGKLAASRAATQERWAAFRRAGLTMLGLELAVLGALSVLVGTFEPVAKVVLIGAPIVIPAVVGFVRASRSPAELSRGATFWRTFVTVLALELLPVALFMIAYGTSCLSTYGYVEF